jgi:Lrp/AsnC family transcriptional regulator, leucine-responsive regulatory protein
MSGDTVRMMGRPAADRHSAGALDDKGKLLIAALRRNARESLVSLARRVGLARSATQERLRRLEKAGVIQGYTVNLGKAEGPATVAAISITFAPGKSCQQIVPHVRPISEIVSCISLAGPVDLMLRVECGSNSDLETIRRRIAAVPGIADVSTHVVLEEHWRAN